MWSTAIGIALFMLALLLLGGHWVVRHVVHNSTGHIQRVEHPMWPPEKDAAEPQGLPPYPLNTF